MKTGNAAGSRIENKKQKGEKSMKMKKQIAGIFMAAAVAGMCLTGCGKSEGSTSESAGKETEVIQTADSAETTLQNTEEEIKTFSGILEEKKDFMFIITGEQNEAYAISFEEAPENYDQLNAGDKVILEYTGELSEIDSFTGEIISLKKAAE